MKGWISIVKSLWFEGVLFSPPLCLLVTSIFGHKSSCFSWFTGVVSVWRSVANWFAQGVEGSGLKLVMFVTVSGSSFYCLRKVISFQAGEMANLLRVLTVESSGPEYRSQIHTNQMSCKIPVTPTLREKTSRSSLYPRTHLLIPVMLTCSCTYINKSFFES